MSRLQSIENALASINETVFQELCDSFLILRNDNYRTFSRVGSQSGKQKTTKGTPDTFYLLPNGQYVFVEYSTNITKGVSKLQEDIEKCLDTTKTKIPINQIAEIILCINFNLSTEEIQSLKNLLDKTRLTLTIYTLNCLSLELHSQHRDLVHKYLGLPLDTGQIVSINTFVEEYNKASKGIATPLNNTFLHREEELENIKHIIKQNDFLIITGVAGVGKTKIAIEAINSFLAENLSYNAFCLSYKNCDLLSDLYQHFDNKKDYEKVKSIVNEFFKTIYSEIENKDYLGAIKIYRIYNDLRFAKDKPPYKTHFGLYFPRKQPKYRGGYYLCISPKETFVGGGFFNPEPKDLLRIRQEIAAEGEEMLQIMESVPIKKYFGGILWGEEVKTAPKGFKKEDPMIDFLRKKQFLLKRDFSTEEVFQENFFEEIVQSFLAMRPFFDFMTRALTTDANGISLYE